MIPTPSFPSIAASPCKGKPRSLGIWLALGAACLLVPGAVADQPDKPAPSPAATATPALTSNQPPLDRKKILFFAEAARASLAASKVESDEEEARGLISSTTKNALWNEVAVLQAHGGNFRAALAAAAYPRHGSSDGFVYFELAMIQAQAGDVAGARESAKHIKMSDPGMMEEVQGEIAVAEARQGDMKAATVMLEPPADPASESDPVQGLSAALSDGVLAGNAQDRGILDKLLAAIPADKAGSIPHLETLLSLQAVGQARANQFDQARSTLARITDTESAVWILRNIAVQQAKTGDRQGARETLAPARALIDADFAPGGGKFPPKRTAAEKDEAERSGFEDPGFEDQADLLSSLAATQVRIGEAEEGKKTIKFLEKAKGRNLYEPMLAELAAFQAESGDVAGGEETARSNPREDMRAKALGFVAQVRLAKGDADGARRNVQAAIGLLKSSKKDQNGSFLGAWPVTKAMAKLGDVAEAVRLAKELEPDRADYRTIDSTKGIAVVVAQQQDTAAAQRWVERQTSDPCKRAMYYVAMGLAFTKPDVIVDTNNTEDE